MRRRRFLTVSCLALWSASSFDALRAWGQVPEAPSRTIQVPQDGRRGSSVVSAVALNTAGTEVAAAGDDHMVRIWKIGDGGSIRTLRGHTDWVRGLAYSPDDRLLASGGDDRNVIVWDAATGQAIRTSQLPARAIYAIAFGPQSDKIAIAGFDSKVHVRSAATGDEVLTLDGTCRDIRAVAWSGDGATLAAAGQDGKLLLWSAATGQLLHTLNADRRRIRGISFSPDNAQIASAGEGRNIRLFDVATGTELAHFDVRGGKLLSLVHCGQDMLATGGSDNIIRFWSLSEKKELRQLAAHTGSIDALDYCSATKTLVSGSYDTTLKFWPMGETTRTTLSPFQPIR